MVYINYSNYYCYNYHYIATSNKCADNCNGNGACDSKTGKCTCLIQKLCTDDRCKTCKIN